MYREQKTRVESLTCFFPVLLLHHADFEEQKISWAWPFFFYHPAGELKNKSWKIKFFFFFLGVHHPREIPPSVRCCHGQCCYERAAAVDHWPPPTRPREGYRFPRRHYSCYLWGPLLSFSSPLVRSSERIRTFRRSVDCVRVLFLASPAALDRANWNRLDKLFVCVVCAACAVENESSSPGQAVFICTRYTLQE